jgi:hypothetical protein
MKPTCLLAPLCRARYAHLLTVSELLAIKRHLRREERGLIVKRAITVLRRFGRNSGFIRRLYEMFGRSTRRIAVEDLGRNTLVGLGGGTRSAVIDGDLSDRLELTSMAPTYSTVHPFRETSKAFAMLDDETGELTHMRSGPPALTGADSPADDEIEVLAISGATNELILGDETRVVR